ncbi:polysaccharide deacetylase family protein [Neobacillus thermocopriae]|uniref:Polysaccharide deacetylase family protein n=1 Tax=Neobacillus thermocopriae TaxID=1215031 RepID=A0A6B3TLY5_9BACI|nr:polysaccharide deacetylase family protein [Neobacillus thermocopriae]MED3622503.1 polysaccharide deacetylase family protein [Neobacillus thermocopriae]MED3714016.1 polysaccharide deacetylase family protein [Neobacillus thermocopriae]NEX77326.1 polysaccharide deacetylase family protein [Neobacillus thermocopriae]
MRRKNRRRKAFIFYIVFGLMFAAIFVMNYFQANAQNNSSNQTNNKSISHEKLSQQVKGDKQEKEMTQKQLEKATAWRNEQEKNKKLDSTSEKTAAAQPATTTPSTTSNQETNSNASHSQATTQENNEKTVYLTFDDGPAAFSGEIIDLLEQYQFDATFFLIDGNIRRYPDAVKLMVESGSTVGLHSVSHDKDLFYASASSVLGELEQNRQTLFEISGINSFLMRTPYGSVPHMKEEYKQKVKDKGYIMWDWNIDSKDWYYKDGRYVDTVIQQIEAKGDKGGPIVILLHERKETLKHLPRLLDYLAAKGYVGKAIDPSMEPVQF